MTQSVTDIRTQRSDQGHLGPIKMIYIGIITIPAPVGANKYTNIVTLVCTAVIGWVCQVIELGAVIRPTDQIASALVVVVTVTLQISSLFTFSNYHIFRAQNVV